MKRYWMEITLNPIKPRWPILHPWKIHISGDTKEELDYWSKEVKAISNGYHGDSVEVISGRIYEFKEIVYDANSKM